MRAPRKASDTQSVRIRSTQSLASSVEVNSAFVAATKQVKPEESMCQAATKVNVLSPVITSVVGVEAFHCDRKQHVRSRSSKVAESYRGLSQWHGTRWVFVELGRSIRLFLSESMRKQAQKGENSQMAWWKSDSLIVLGARESLVHGEAVSDGCARLRAGQTSTRRLG
jgi:hypothetical protein